MIEEDQHLRVLLVESPALADHSLATTLATDGPDVVLSSDIAAMREALAAEQFDVVLLDAALPGALDAELWRALRAPRAAPEFVVIGASGQPAAALRGVALGAAGVLMRPCDGRSSRPSSAWRGSAAVPASGAGCSARSFRVRLTCRTSSRNTRPCRPFWPSSSAWPAATRAC